MGNIWLGNILFDQVEDKLGYALTEEDKEIWNRFHNSNAELKGMNECFHVFDIPRCIHFKGEKAKEAILKMFTKDKIVKTMGTFAVYDMGEKG